MENGIFTSVVVPVFLMLISFSEAVDPKESLETTSDALSPATPKIVKIPAGISNALEDFILSAKLAENILNSLPRDIFNSIRKEDKDAAMADKFVEIMSYHLVDSDEAYKILKKVEDKGNHLSEDLKPVDKE